MKNAFKSLFAGFVICCLLFPAAGFSQNNMEVKRVSYTLSNPAVKSRDLDIRYFDPVTKKTAGYGFHLGPLQSHADNKPVGTRIYLKKDGAYHLAFVLADGDNGRKFSVGKDYEITQAQRTQASLDEQAERTVALENPEDDDDLSAFAERHKVPMVTFQVTGSSPVKRQVHVRAQLPFVDKKTNNGFSGKVSSLRKMPLSYPAGTKIYLCDGPYWNEDVPETLLWTVEAGKADYVIKI